MKYLMVGIKTLVWGVLAMGQPQQSLQQQQQQPQGSSLLRAGFSMSETHVLCKLLKNMYKSFSVHARMNPSPMEEKDVRRVGGRFAWRPLASADCVCGHPLGAIGVN